MSRRYYQTIKKRNTPNPQKQIRMEWTLSDVQLPTDGENVEVSEDGITSDGTADYKSDRRCMMAGIAGGNGYFSECGFATDGSTGCEKNLILDTPKYWRNFNP